MSEITLKWLSGPIGDETLQEVAELLVNVDTAFGDEPWWFPVRNKGIDGAFQILDLPWHGHVLAVTTDNKIVGFGGMDKPLENSVEFSRIMVHPGWRERDIGTSIIEKLKDVALAEGLLPWVDVLETSVPAIELYSKAGFETVGYQYGRDSGRLARQMRYKAPENAALV